MPVPTMITSASGVSSGRSIILPLGPVRVTSCPGFALHKKLEHTPFCFRRAQRQRGAGNGDVRDSAIGRGL